jgi:hypothetical protein
MKYTNEEPACQECGDPLFIGSNWTAKYKRAGKMICSFCEHPTWKKPKKPNSQYGFKKGHEPFIAPTNHRVGIKRHKYTVHSDGDGEYAKISLPQGKFILVDLEDVKLVSKFNWRCYPSRNTFYADRRSSESEKDKYKSTVPMHRFILGLTSQDFEETGLVVDHINGNGLDNRKSNLRVVTARQNTQNQKRKTSSKYPGVSWNKNAQKWQARIGLNGKLRHLGLFVDEREAAKAYEQACRELAGEELICKTKGVV